MHEAPDRRGHWHRDRTRRLQSRAAGPSATGRHCGTQRDHDDDIADPGTDDASIAVDIEDESDDASGRLHNLGQQLEVVLRVVLPVA